MTTKGIEKSKLILRVEDKVWDSFKRTVSRGIDLNDAVVFHLKEHIKWFEQQKTIPLSKFLGDIGDKDGKNK